jgi:hypothetical protein
MVQIDGVTPGSSYEVYSIGQKLIRSGVMTNNTLGLELQSGVYILRVEDDEGVMMQKIVIR